MLEHGTTSSADPVSPPTERMLGLSDALFGIAITFLALDFGADPPQAAADVGGYLEANLWNYLAYGFTFLLVGFQWWRHHKLFRFVKRRTDTLLLINSLLLAFVALVPFGMQVLGRNGGSAVSLVLFAGMMASIGGLLCILWEYAVRRRLVIPNLDPSIVKHVRIQLLIMPASFLVVMAGSFLIDFPAGRTGGFGFLLLTVAVGVIATALLARPAASVAVVRVDAEETRRSGASAAGLLGRIRDGSRSDRLTVFTDGIFAVALTIMALRLTPPQRPLTDGADLVAMLSENSAALVAYCISFYVITQQWIRHVHLFDREILVDARILWLNLILLMFVAFMPFATELIAQPGGRIAVLLYLAILSAATITETTLVITAKRQERIVGMPVDPALVRRRRAERLATTAILAVALTLGAVMPDPENGLYALMLFIALDPICRRVAPLPPRAGAS
ncbi:MAG: hypothetical protein CMJ52_05610 [Planctomycetaceae bacterium]|nr:hypothetical protein [Planctomycetaceae bacterium]